MKSPNTCSFTVISSPSAIFPHRSEGAVPKSAPPRALRTSRGPYGSFQHGLLYAKVYRPSAPAARFPRYFLSYARRGAAPPLLGQARNLPSPRGGRRGRGASLLATPPSLAPRLPPL